MRRRNRRQWAHLALAATGVAAVLWAVLLSANPTIWCRDQVMHPGEVCTNAQGTKVQTYEAVSYTHLTLPTNREV